MKNATLVSKIGENIEYLKHTIINISSEILSFYYFYRCLGKREVFRSYLFISYKLFTIKKETL